MEALDLDIAIATRARAAEQDELEQVMQHEEAFFAAVITLLNR